MTDRAITTTFNEDDYAKLLQQAVAVIDASRLQIARQLNAVAISTISCKFAINKVYSSLLDRL